MNDLEVVARELTRRHLTIAVTESCTGGLLSKLLTDRAGSSVFMQAGFIVYSNNAKQRFLNVKSSTLEQFGAVSEQTAREMLDGVRDAGRSDAGISITGIAGPDGGTPEKPVGTVWIGASVNDRAAIQRFLFEGNRTEIRERSAWAAIAMLRTLIEQIPE